MFLRRSLAGFSLVEMLAALGIFSLGVVATLQVFTVCLRSTGISRDYTRASFLAQELMEEALAEGNFTVGQESGDLSDVFPGATWTREVSETETAGLYSVRVSVLWSERGRERVFELTTLAAER